MFLGLIDANVNSVDAEWCETITVANVPIKFQLDTGAKCNVLPYSTFQKLGKLSLDKSKKARLKSYTNHKIWAKGRITLDCVYKDTVRSVVFEVVDLDSEAVLGAKSCVDMGLVQRVHVVVPSRNVTMPSNTFDIPDDIWSEYEENFKGIGLLPGKHHIKIDSSVEPVVHPPRRVPIALREKIKAELDRMEDIGVIVKQNQPTPWVNSMVTVLKPNGKLRICIDPRDLNKAIQREHYPLKTIEDVVQGIPEAKVFSKLDATSGFWQIALDSDSSKLCTFNTPFGRYSFTRLPFGIKSASEVYQKTISEMVQDIDGCEAIIDDILIWGRDMQEHDARLRTVMKRVSDFNLKLSPEKCQFRKDRVSYVGHVLTSEGVKPDFEKVRAVQEMEAPRNVSELQTFMGFITYLAKFLPNLSEVSAPLRSLLQKEVEWHWDSEQENSFVALKKLVTNAPVLSYYDPKKPLVLTVDASSKGLGAAVVQEGRPIAYASRALTSSQQNYAQIEKEALAIAFGCAKFHQYIIGRTVKVESYHKPLQSIFRKPLYQAPARLQSILLTLQRYDLEVEYKPGKLMFLADTLSRAYLKESNEKLAPDIAVNSLSYLPITPEQYESFQLATREDRELQTLQGIVKSGWPEAKTEIPITMRAYWPYRDEISCVDGLMFKGHKIIVPHSLRAEMLDRIHSSHLGIVKCKSRARETLYWPGMTSQIEDLVSKCTICVMEYRQNSKEPLMETETPDRPWSIISADLFDLHGHAYLITVDHYSKWPELAKLDNQSSVHTIQHLKSQFARYGIPDKFISDNGPQFSSDSFKKFAKDYGFTHVTSSPHFPQSNGQAERTVQTVKSLLRKASDSYKALLAYRNTPLEKLGLSPAQLFIGRRLKTDLPTTAVLLKPEPHNSHEVEERIKTKKYQDKLHYDKNAGKELRDLYPGENAIARHDGKWTAATVVEKHTSPRSYIVQTQSGRKLRRNRRDIRPTPAKFAQRQQPDLDANNEVVPSSGENLSSTSQDVSPPSDPPIDAASSSTKISRSGRAIQMPKKFQEFEM